jgi:hypothetical protein
MPGERCYNHSCREMSNPTIWANKHVIGYINDHNMSAHRGPRLWSMTWQPWLPLEYSAKFLHAVVSGCLTQKVIVQIGGEGLKLTSQCGQYKNCGAMHVECKGMKRYFYARTYCSRSNCNYSSNCEKVVLPSASLI